MALRLRRGTDTQRLLITPAEGELIYTTDTKRLWVGDGSTQGGVLVNTGAVYGLDDLVDVDLTSPPTTGDILKFDGEKFIAASEAPFTPGGNYYINITDVSGTTLLVDVANANFNGNFFGPVIGSVTGNVQGNLTGNVQGSVFGNVEGSLTGDVQGSVFGDNSTLLVDGINNSLSTGPITLRGSDIISGNPEIRLSHSNTATTVRLNQVTPNGRVVRRVVGITGVSGPGELWQTSRGTLTAPTALQPGDILSSYSNLGYNTGGATVYSTIFRNIVDPNGEVTEVNVPGCIELFTIENGDVVNGYKGVSIDSQGYVAINHLRNYKAQATLDINGFAKLAILSAEPANPSDGMIAIADGDPVNGWDPLGLGAPAAQQLVVYLDGFWRHIAGAS